MNISVFGLGHVGAVLTGCLAHDGHHVVGVDTDPGKVAQINAGKSPIIEPDLEALIAEGVRTGHIRATTDHRHAVLATDLSMACVGTPSGPYGDLDLKFIERVCEAIGEAIREKSNRHLIVFRSTILPGTIQGTAIPILERASGKPVGIGFGVAINPEFMRESTAVNDYYHPPKTVIGALVEPDADTIARLYAHLPAPLIKTRMDVAEMVKYVDNTFHALKITFANEIGQICRSLGVDSQAVMDIFGQDQKLNISRAYLKPGFAYGGSCLPKDLRALERLACNREVKVPLLNSIAVSNEQQIQNALQLIQSKGRKSIGVLGFAFKAGTDDLRESPMVTLVEMLLGTGYDVQLYDPCVSQSRQMGASRRYIAEFSPHISQRMVGTLEELIEHAELIVVGNQNPEFAAPLAQLASEKIVIDLTTRIHAVGQPGQYERLGG